MGRRAANKSGKRQKKKKNDDSSNNVAAADGAAAVAAVAAPSPANQLLSTHVNQHMSDELPPLDEICAAEYLRNLDGGLTEVTVDVSTIIDRLLEMSNIPRNDLEAAEAPTHKSLTGIAAARAAAAAAVGASASGSSATAAAAAAAAASASAGGSAKGPPNDLSTPSSAKPSAANTSQPLPVGTAEAAYATAAVVAIDANNPRYRPPVSDAEALEASIMARLPPSIVERIYDRFDSVGLRCPAGCQGRLHLEEFEQHCIDHLEHEREREEQEERSLAQQQQQVQLAGTALVDATAVAPVAAPLPLSTASASPLDSGANEDIIIDDLLSLDDQCFDFAAALIDLDTTASSSAAAAAAVTAIPPTVPAVPQMPQFVQVDKTITMRIPPPLPRSKHIEPDDLDEPFESVLEWLYYDAEQSANERWASLYSAFRAVNKRITTLNPLIDAKEQVLRIRGQVAADYQRKIGSMDRGAQPESDNVRKKMVEMLCLATVVDNYLEVTKQRVQVYETDQVRVSQLAKRMQEKIVETTKQVEAYTREMDQIDASELQTLRDEISMVQELSIKGKGRRKPGIRAFESDKHRQAKEELSKKVEICQRKTTQFKEKYSSTLQLLVKVREKLSSQQSMEQDLLSMQNECHRRLEQITPPNPEAITDVSEAVALADNFDVVSAPIGLAPILRFEKQETDDLDRLMDEHAAKMEERQQLFEMMRESVYTDPVLKVVKSTVLQRLDEMAANARRKMQVAQKEREEQQAREREAILESLLKKEEEDQRKKEAKERSRREADERQRQQKLMEKQKVMERERERRQLLEDEERARRQAEEDKLQEKRLQALKMEQDFLSSTDFATNDRDADLDDDKSSKSDRRSKREDKRGKSGVSEERKVVGPKDKAGGATPGSAMVGGRSNKASVSSSGAAAGGAAGKGVKVKIPGVPLGLSSAALAQVPAPLPSTVAYESKRQRASSALTAVRDPDDDVDNATAPRRSKEKALCRDFLRGSCPRGSQCSWLHVKGTLESQPLCKDFQRGVCTRKPCAFLHLTPKDLATIKTGKGDSDSDDDDDSYDMQPEETVSMPASAPAAAAGAGKGVSTRPQPVDFASVVRSSDKLTGTAPKSATLPGPASFSAVTAANLPTHTEAPAVRTATAGNNTSGSNSGNANASTLPPPSAFPPPVKASGGGASVAKGKAVPSSSTSSSSSSMTSMGFPAPPPPLPSASAGQGSGNGSGGRNRSSSNSNSKKATAEEAKQPSPLSLAESSSEEHGDAVADAPGAMEAALTMTMTMGGEIATLSGVSTLPSSNTNGSSENEGFQSGPGTGNGGSDSSMFFNDTNGGFSLSDVDSSIWNLPSPDSFPLGMGNGGAGGNGADGAGNGAGDGSTLRHYGASASENGAFMDFEQPDSTHSSLPHSPQQQHMGMPSGPNYMLAPSSQQPGNVYSRAPGPHQQQQSLTLQHQHHQQQHQQHQQQQLLPPSQQQPFFEMGAGAVMPVYGQQQHQHMAPLVQQQQQQPQQPQSHQQAMHFVGSSGRPGRQLDGAGQQQQQQQQQLQHQHPRQQMQLAQQQGVRYQSIPSGSARTSSLDLGAGSNSGDHSGNGYHPGGLRQAGGRAGGGGSVGLVPAAAASGPAWSGEVDYGQPQSQPHVAYNNHGYSQHSQAAVVAPAGGLGYVQAPQMIISQLGGSGAHQQHPQQQQQHPHQQQQQMGMAHGGGSGGGYGGSGSAKNSSGYGGGPRAAGYNQQQPPQQQPQQQYMTPQQSYMAPQQHLMPGESGVVPPQQQHHHHDSQEMYGLGVGTGAKGGFSTTMKHIWNPDYHNAAATAGSRSDYGVGVRPAAGMGRSDHTSWLPSLEHEHSAALPNAGPPYAVPSYGPGGGVRAPPAAGGYAPAPAHAHAGGGSGAMRSMLGHPDAGHLPNDQQLEEEAARLLQEM